VDALFTHLSKEQAAKNSLLEEEDIFSLVRTPPRVSPGAEKTAAATRTDVCPPVSPLVCLPRCFSPGGVIEEDPRPRVAQAPQDVRGPVSVSSALQRKGGVALAQEDTRVWIPLLTGWAHSALSND
jgi:hypothetical protein